MSKKPRRRATKPERSRPRTPAQRERMVKAIYARIKLENLECRGLCHDSCGAIGYSMAEARVMADKYGRPPMANAATTGGFRVHSDIMCDKLTHDKRCGIYDDRPAICRVYGMFPKLACAHGCVPKEWMTDAEAQEILVELDLIEGPHGPSHQLASMVAAAARAKGIIQ